MIEQLKNNNNNVGLRYLDLLPTFSFIKLKTQEIGSGWQSRRTCTHLLQEHQNCNQLFNNHLLADNHIKILLSMTLPTRTRPSFSHCILNNVSISMLTQPSQPHPLESRQKKQEEIQSDSCQNEITSQTVNQNENTEDYVLDERTR